MLNELRNGSLMLVFISAAGFIYYYLLPDGRVSETAKAVISLLCMLVICVPLFNIVSDGEINIFKYSSEGETSVYEPYSYYAEIAEKTVEEKLSLIIRKYTDYDFYIETDINISDDMSIDIKQVSVIFEKYPENMAELSVEIGDELGIPPRFELKENEND